MSDADNDNVALEETEAGEPGSEFALRCGVTLRLQAVNAPAIRYLVLKLGGAEALNEPEKLRELAGAQAIAAAKTGEQLFTYCMGWGIEDDPPEEALATLEALGVSGGGPHIERANWARFLLLEDDEEAGRLMGAILALTFRAS